MTRNYIYSAARIDFWYVFQSGNEFRCCYNQLPIAGWTQIRTLENNREEVWKITIYIDDQLSLWIISQITLSFFFFITMK